MAELEQTKVAPITVPGRRKQPMHRNGDPRIDLRLQNVKKRFGGISAVNGVELSLEKGKLLALLGPSGCGKTTTLRLIAGFERLDEGTIEIGGNLVASPGNLVPPEKRRVGMVFQEYALFPHMTVADNILFGLQKTVAAQRDLRVGEVMDLVGLHGLGQRMPHELSGGQQQRVALARALAPQPDLILLDEPFSNLDAGLRVRVRSEVRAILKQAGATAVFVTHDQEEALSLVDEVAVMLGGRIQQIASPQELYWRPISRRVAEFIGDTNFLPGNAMGRKVECEFGVLEAQKAYDGPVDVLIRPENIDVTPAPPGNDVPRVLHNLFFGHDQLISVRLPSGRTIDVRVGPTYQLAAGQPVSLRIRGLVMIYPR